MEEKRTIKEAKGRDNQDQAAKRENKMRGARVIHRKQIDLAVVKLNQ
jgi:hypothetical protein